MCIHQHKCYNNFWYLHRDIKSAVPSKNAVSVNIVDTSIQTSYILSGCVYILFDMVVNNKWLPLLFKIYIFINYICVNNLLSGVSDNTLVPCWNWKKTNKQTKTNKKKQKQKQKKTKTKQKNIKQLIPVKRDI